MKSKQNLNKKNTMRSVYNESDNRLKPVKSKSGKNNKKISIYDNLDDDFDESELNMLRHNDYSDNDEEFTDNEY